MIVHRDLRVAYLAHPRTASIATVRALCGIGFEELLFHHAQVIDWPEWNHFSREERDRWEIWTTVRNPYDALVSWWHAVSYNHPRLCPEWVHKILQHDPKYMLHERLFALHGHAATTVLRFESIEADVEREALRLGLPVPTWPAPGTQGRNQTDGRHGRPYQDYYDDETKDYVAFRLKPDFEDFGYEWEERAALTA